MDSWLANYCAERHAVIEANGGMPEISVVSLLPNAPAGVWNRVSQTVAELRSPLHFLSNLFCELRFNASGLIPAEPLSLDGFLGSYGSRQKPDLLIPAMSLWLRSSDPVSDAAKSVADVIHNWEILVGRRLPVSATQFPPADELGPFLAHGRVPNSTFSASFLAAVSDSLSRRHSNER
jgi:hypothetical protein